MAKQILSLERCRTFGERPFILDEREGLSYVAFTNKVTVEERAFDEAGAAAGAVVGLAGPCTPELLAMLFALVNRKAIVVPVTGETGPEREKRFRAAGVEWVAEIGGAEDRRDGGGRMSRFERRAAAAGSRHPLVRQLAEEGRAGLVLFSSGTTGAPKAMLHDWDRLLGGYVFKAKGSAYRILAFLPCDHIGGLDVVFRAMASGSSLAMPENRNPDTVARLIERHRIEVLPASPTFLNLFLLSGATERYDLRSLKIIAYGAEPMPEPVLRRLRERFPNVAFQQKFGTSETSAVRVVGRAAGSLEMKIEDPRVEWKVVDRELWIRTPSRILGYLNAEESALTGDGWYRTGDLVEETGEGYFRIVGRSNEVINVGGEKVLPSEVESVLHEMPEIRDCRVYGEENALTGRVVAAEVVASRPMQASELKKRIRAFCRERLEPYKVPVKVYCREALETGANMKKRRAEGGVRNYEL